MATESKFRGRSQSVFAVALAASATAGALAGHLHPAPLPEGAAPRVQPSLRPTVEAAFPRESYAPGSVARLVLFDRVASASVQLFRAGTERSRLGPRDVMLGTAVAPPTRIRGTRSVRLRLGNWPSGLYFARVTSGAGVGFAPFVLRPRRLGEHRIAVVFPMLTWQAYNFRDDDGDGSMDSWYADGSKSVRLGRPFENRGVPPHYKHYDQPFLRWLIEQRRDVDYLGQSDVEAAAASKLASAYDFIVFPGHHEYVTTREYDVVTRYRDLGGNLAFLSANNFYWKVERRKGTLRRVAHWRALGRPEAALIGVQYIGNDMGEHRGPWLVRRAGTSSWVFDGITGAARQRFSNGGIEIDKTARSSPRGTQILAEIPNLLGRGMTAQMTYYETPAGAKVFAAGAFSLAGAIRQQPVAQLVANLLDRLGNDRSRGPSSR
jgi:hypothetical protein